MFVLKTGFMSLLLKLYEQNKHNGYKKRYTYNGLFFLNSYRLKSLLIKK